MSMETSRVWSQRLNPIIGDTFVTNLRNKILGGDLNKISNKWLGQDLPPLPSL